MLATQLVEGMGSGSQIRHADGGGAHVFRVYTRAEPFGLRVRADAVERDRDTDELWFTVDGQVIGTITAWVSFYREDLILPPPEPDEVPSLMASPKMGAGGTA